ncbi:hypothetical protein ASG36_09930 [Geodermatophilus sp. Leaf369]|uniref:hypothetical protein n=1 Tax=Geodermatophilus sp. Leaf369 TaxID=1736354 RepID=UPI0006F93CA3|nr:hypothetical protein [Geodermatophilus sp. Leaf369]KQS58393.1 hypothetical protein ASG36_09930 [Geodermatophilus sp. Leaf369]
MTDVRALLHDLSADAPTGHGAATADRVVAVHRAQDRRRRGWAAVAVAVALVVAGTPALLDAVRPADGAVAAAPGDADLGLYDVPTRGSWAGDAELVEQALAADWDDGTATAVDPPAGTRRVVFVGDVLGGQAWALVLGRVDGQTWSTWFVDVTPEDGITWQRASGPDRSFPDTPMGLVDTAGEQGRVVVVASPDDEVRFRAGAGETGYRTTQTVDGIAVAVVPTPESPATVAAFQVLRDGAVVYDQPPQRFDSTALPGDQPAAVPPADAPPDAEFGRRMVDCLLPLGWDVSVLGEGYDHRLQPGQDATAYDAAVESCLLRTGYR